MPATSVFSSPATRTSSRPASSSFNNGIDFPYWFTAKRMQSGGLIRFIVARHQLRIRRRSIGTFAQTQQAHRFSSNIGKRGAANFAAPVTAAWLVRHYKDNESRLLRGHKTH